MPAASRKNTFSPLSHPDVLKASTSKGKPVPIHVVRVKDFENWIKTQTAAHQSLLSAQDWKASPGSVALLRRADGSLESIYVGTGPTLSLYTFSQAVDTLQKNIPSAALEKLTFALAPSDLSKDEITFACTGWALACYQFDAFKASTKINPALLLPKDADKTRIQALVQSISLIRNLINLPANVMGPKELAAAAKSVAVAKQATIKITEDKKLLADNFPLIYGVGDSSDNRPRLVDLKWGKSTDPKITLVGKGVCFDTGGLDLKPSAGMLTMKKDMGGAAMVLGLAWMIMTLKLPVRLRVLIPAVENSVSGRAYRPMDILPSRKGLTVEIGNTDAEGRLVMADCLALACEEKPDLLIDFSTLTGHIRTALGMDMPAIFSNRDQLAQELQAIAMAEEDPMWHMPLYQPYKPDILTPNADLSNSGSNQAGGITAALFLESFVDQNIDWIHIDHSAWEINGKPGRPRGGADMGMRAVLSLLEKKYSRKKPGK